MASSLFENWRTTNAPSWLMRTWGQKWLRAHGQQEDEAVDDAIQSAKCGLPSYCPVDALPSLGTERQILRNPNDSDANYRARLQAAWQTWSRAGKPLAILLALEELGYAPTVGNPILAQQNGWLLSLNADTTLDPWDRLVVTNAANNPAIGGINPIVVNTVPWWTFTATDLDADTDQFNSRFALLITQPAQLAAWTNVLSPPTDVSAPTKAEVNSIIRTVNHWRPEKAQFVKIMVFGDATGNDVTWGYPPTQGWGEPFMQWGGGVAGSVVTTWNGTEYP